MPHFNKHNDTRLPLSKDQIRELKTLGMHRTSTSVEGKVIKDEAYNMYDDNAQTYPLQWIDRSMCKPLPIRDDIDLFGTLDKSHDYHSRFILLMQHSMNDLGQLCRYDSHIKTFVPVRTKEELWTVADMKRTAGKKFINTLIGKRLIKEYKGSYMDDKGKVRTQSFWYVSPTIFQTKCIHPDTYMLFKDELDELLQPFCRERLAKAWAIMHSIAPKKKAKSEALLNRAKINEGDLVDFVDTMYGDELPLFFYDCTKYVANPDLDEVPTNLFYMLQPAKDGARMHSAAAVKEFRFVSLDVDIKKDGKAFSDDDLDNLEHLKLEAYDILKELPEPTTLVRTRNGWQLVWKLDQAIDEDQWRDLQTMVSDAAGDFADRNAVKAGGVLRCPGTYHKKEGTACYPVQLIENNSIAYDAEDLEMLLSGLDCAEKAKAFFDEHPELTKAKKSVSKAVTSINHASSDSERISKIASLTPFSMADKEIDFSSEAEAKDYIKRQDIAKFLNITTDAGSFNCIFHHDRHPSAFITELDGYSRYVCRSSNCELYSEEGIGDDIIGVVRRLRGCSYKAALVYLCTVYGVSYPGMYNRAPVQDITSIKESQAG